MEKLDFFALDFNVTGGKEMGFWATVATGLIVPIWTIFLLNVGLRKKFGSARLFDHAKESKLGKAWAMFQKCLIVIFAIFVLCFVLGFRFEHFYMIVPILTILGFLTFSSLAYERYLVRWQMACDKANEDFGKKRQRMEMTLFVFLFTIVYLSGVSGCASLAFYADVIPNRNTTGESVRGAKRQSAASIVLLTPF